MGDWWIVGPEPWSRADWLSLGQLVFTVFGFAIAIWQIVRTARASESTGQKIDSLHARMAGNDLLVALPRIQGLEEAIDQALKSEDASELGRALLDYSRGTGEVIAMLEVRVETKDERLVGLLQQASNSALRARGQLSKGGDKSLVETVQPAGAKIAKASVEISALVARLQRKVEVNGSA